MLQRILSILGWIGTALVLVAVAIRILRPEWDTYAGWAAWGGLTITRRGRSSWSCRSHQAARST